MQREPILTIHLRTIVNIDRAYLYGHHCVCSHVINCIDSTWHTTGRFNLGLLRMVVVQEIAQGWLSNHDAGGCLSNTAR